jgi:glucosamine kinase
MLLIADSGSTKTDWLLMNADKEVLRLKSVGFNPYFVDTQQIYHELAANFAANFDLNSVQEVYYYGAGCSSPSKKAVVDNALKLLFPNAQTLVEHDLLGAARALLGHEKGIAGILGTGSNSCLYDGNDVVGSLFSLGYFFGDEGSGAYLGKRYLQEHLKKRVPEEIYRMFEANYTYTPEDILTHVYKKPNPNRFLASFSVFVKSQIHHPFIEKMVLQCFEDYFNEMIKVYDGFRDLKFSCIGSVGYNFRDQIEKVFHAHGVELGRFLISPVEGLKEFHVGTKS